MEKEILLIAEHTEGKINPSAHELITFAENLKEIDPCRINILVPGSEIKNAGGRLAESSGIDVTCIENTDLKFYNAEAYIQAVCDFVSTRNVKYICTLHTSKGFDYAPALAVKLNAACITSIEKISEENNQPVFSRSAFNSKIKMIIKPDAGCSVLTVLPGAFPAAEADKKTSRGKCKILKWEFTPERTKTRGISSKQQDDYPITEAEIIISAGKGIGKEENLELIHSLAGIFPRAAIGASRIVCDQGWLDYSHQVGTTGKTVSPGLYVACGISGTVQHVSGIKKSRLIVAINKDPNAAIFNIADYCVVEDLLKFIPVFIEKYRASE